MSLVDLNLKGEYRTTDSNVVKDFYVPVLGQSILYQRAVGFFSSSALIQVVDGLSGLLKNNGRIQLIVSPKLSLEDIEAIRSGYENRLSIIESRIIELIDELDNYSYDNRLILLSKLIENKKLDIKIAFSTLNGSFGIFHEKLGLMYDASGNYLSFSGSLNESETAYSFNVECIDVYRSWVINDLERVELKKKAFDNMWENNEKGIEIIDFPKIALDKIINSARKNEDTNKRETADIPKSKNDDSADHKTLNSEPSIPNSLVVRDYQIAAIDNWKFNNYLGIFDMATGTGKTITGLLGLVELYKAHGRLFAIIIAPYTHLVEQWTIDLSLFNIEPIIGYSDPKYKNYYSKLKSEIENYNLGLSKFACFITTNASFRTKKIQKLISYLSNDSLIIVDEAHNFGAEFLRTTLPENIKYRLALSATLERHHDPVGTRSLYNYFGSKCIEYSLEKAIEEKMLSPYKYYPIVTNLTEEELLNYERLTIEIAKHQKEVNGIWVIDEYGKMLLIKRSRIIAGAINKLDKLLSVIKDYTQLSNILIYCGATSIQESEVNEDEIRQIDFISRKLYEMFGMKTSQFTSKEDREARSKIIEMFVNERINAVVAIKCLDEGVNIPSIKTAFILASTTNPKEHVQRRGRVLRLSKNKKYSEIYDFVVLPRRLEQAKNLSFGELLQDRGLLLRELKRVYEFAKLSMNSEEGYSLISEITETYQDINWSEITESKQEEYK